MDTADTNGTGDDTYDQDAEPTMTAPDGARPDGKKDALQDESGSGGAESSGGSGGSGDAVTSIEQEMGSGGGGND